MEDGRRSNRRQNVSVPSTPRASFPERLLDQARVVGQRNKVRFYTDFGLIINTVLEIINSEEHRLKGGPLKRTRKKGFPIPEPPSKAQFWKISE